MPDSIFDMQQKLFTSSLPVPAPRDRGQERSTGFDQALDSAQRNNRDDQTVQDSEQAAAADNQNPADHKKTKDVSETNPSENTIVTEQATVVNSDQLDEVTLSQDNSKAAPTAEEGIVPRVIDADSEGVEESNEPTAEEISTAVVLPLDPAKPVIKQAPQQTAEQAEQHEGIELNDAVQPISKRGPNKPVTQTPPATSELPIQKLEAPAAAEDAAVVDPNTVVIVSELHSTKVTPAIKNQQPANKNDQAKSARSENPKHQLQADTKHETGEYAPGAFAVTVSPESEGEVPAAPKRRLDTTRQSMPEVHESELKLAAPIVLNTTTATALETSAAPSATTAETPQIPTISATTTETPIPPNHLRGPQIPHSFANHLEAAAAERKSSDPLNTVDRTRFVQRVARAFQRAGETDGEIRLRLSPPELGAVKLEVSLRDGAMIARMETETTTARNLLMENLPQLKERLAEQNVRIETFEVEVRDQSNHSSADDAREQLREQTEQQRNRLRGERATTPVVAQPIVRTLPAARQSSQLNVVI